MPHVGQARTEGQSVTPSTSGRLMVLHVCRSCRSLLMQPSLSQRSDWGPGPFHSFWTLPAELVGLVLVSCTYGALYTQVGEVLPLHTRSALRALMWETAQGDIGKKNILNRFTWFCFRSKPHIQHLLAEIHSTLQQPGWPWSLQSAAFPPQTDPPVAALLGTTTVCCTVWFPPTLQGIWICNDPEKNKPKNS